MPPLYLCVKARLCPRRAYFSIFPLLFVVSRARNERTTKEYECGGKALRTTKKETKKRRIWSRRGGGGGRRRENFRSQEKKEVTEEEEEK